MRGNKGRNNDMKADMKAGLYRATVMTEFGVAINGFVFDNNINKLNNIIKLQYLNNAEEYNKYIEEDGTFWYFIGNDIKRAKYGKSNTIEGKTIALFINMENGIKDLVL